MKFRENVYGQQLAEIDQSLDIRMSFARRDKDGHYVNIHEFVKCRDFLGDVLHAVEEKKSVGIYGFKYNPKKMLQPYKNKTLIVCTFPTDESRNNFIANFHRLGQFDKKIRLYGVENHNNFILVEGDRVWMKSVAGISFFTFLLKCIGYKLNDLDFWTAVSNTTVEKQDWDGKKRIVATTEASYYNQAKATLNTFIKNIKKLTKGLETVHGHPKASSVNHIHNNSGFVTVCKLGYGEVGERLFAL